MIYDSINNNNNNININYQSFMVFNLPGILDCIGDYEGVRCLIEWKTAKKKKSSIQYTYDNPVQVCDAWMGR